MPGTITRFPVEEQAERAERFAAQLLAWRWFFSQSVEKDSRYLEVLALHKLTRPRPSTICESVRRGSPLPAADEEEVGGRRLRRPAAE